MARLVRLSPRFLRRLEAVGVRRGTPASAAVGATVAALAEAEHLRATDDEVVLVTVTKTPPHELSTRNVWLSHLLDLGLPGRRHEGGVRARDRVPASLTSQRRSWLMCTAADGSSSTLGVDSLHSPPSGTLDALTWSETITIDPEIQGGAPVIRGTRVPVSVLVDAVAAGDPIDAVATAYRVTVEQVQAALAYAADLVRDERAIALPR